MNPKTFDVSKVKVDPAYAREILLLNQHNRPLNSHRVAKWAKEMSEGHWKFNGDPIRISKSNRLLDGQHKLHAIILSGTTQEMVIMRGLDDDVFDTIDVGAKRTSGDIFAILGEKNCGVLSASLNLLTNYYANGCNKRESYPVTTLRDTLEQHPTMRHSVAMFTKGKAKLMPQSCAACLHYLFSRRDPLLAEAFFESVFTGTNLSSTDPVYVLRERLVANCAARSKYSTIYIMAITVKAWNAVKSKKPIRVLSWRGGEDAPELFPDIK